MLGLTIIEPLNGTGVELPQYLRHFFVREYVYTLVKNEKLGTLTAGWLGTELGNLREIDG